MKLLDTARRYSRGKVSRSYLFFRSPQKSDYKSWQNQDFDRHIVVNESKLRKHLLIWRWLLTFRYFSWLVFRQLKLNKIKQSSSWLLPLSVGILIWFLPSPTGVEEQAWHLLAIFLATIVGFVTKPLPIGATAIIALAVLVTSNTLTIEQGLSGFSEKTAWLTVNSFLIARAIIKTGLGTRIAYLFITLFGKSTLLLSYGILLTDFVLSPVMPSGNARGGGVIFPIVKSLATAYRSEPNDGTKRKIGAFLMITAYQGTQITTALFLTAMVSNPLMAQLAYEIAGVQIDWLTWALAALLPGSLSMLIMPLLVYWCYPPQLKSTPEAPKLARRKLQEMGNIKQREWAMLGIFTILLLLWGWGKQLWGIESVTTSLIGVVLLLMLRVLTWKDIIREQKTWDIFIWFSILLMMASFLSQFGLIDWVSNLIGSMIQDFWWQTAFVCLSVAYFYSNYFFASKAARASAMYPAFLALAISLGTPPMYAALVLAFLVNLSGCLTHYATAEAPIYFATGYVDAATWCKLGFYLSLAYLIIWTVIGGFWWQLLGLI